MIASEELAAGSAALSPGTPDTSPIELPEVEQGDPFYVVGVGASAGGLEALEQFFDNVPVDSGLCFIVVQHLSPDFRSMMDELLARRTRIPIERVEHGVAIQRDRIYLMPARKEMILSGGRLLLTDKDTTQGFALPIDKFLRSLAQDAGSRSVAVILSGTGSDGSRGLREVHDAGGLVVAQSEESARFDGMPRSARETGLVDLILPAADIPEAILSFVRRISKSGNEATSSAAEVGLQAIFRLLRDEYHIDFSQYKLSTVTRRVERRLLLNQSFTVERYIQRLTEEPGELNQLYKDLLIGVTQFFRDAEAFVRLEREELPRLLESIDENQEFRVWVACCATGEEAYSLAILIREALDRRGRQPQVRIFATDVHRDSLDTASAGLYSEDSMLGVSQERRERFFTRKGNGYQVVPQLRKMIVFAPHDVLRDAPFTRLDLISCRNMLIYLQANAQKKALSLFHFGLKAGGLLFLGPSESPGTLLDEFDTVDEHWKVFRKRRDIRLRPDFRLSGSQGIAGQAGRTRTAGPAAAAASADRLQQQLYDRLLEEHMPPSFLINDRRELLHCFGGSGKFLRLGNGRATNQLLELVDSDTKMILLGALTRVEKLQTSVVFAGLRIHEADGTERLTRLTVKPLHDRVAARTSFLIILEPMDPPKSLVPDSEVDLGAASREQVHTLEHELRHTRENLQAMIEEQESSNEELQATNEELVASNEQLQSTNEELHSVNEELYTVNAEYQQKIDELMHVTADLESLFQATDVGTLFLDRSLKIRRFTPRAAKLFNLLPQDLGRPIRSFTTSLQGPVVEWLQQVLESLEPIEQEIRDREGNIYFVRVVPYHLSPEVVEGVVVSLVDISVLKRTEARLLHLSSIVESSSEAIVGKTLDGVIVSWNRGAEEMFGYTAEEMVGQDASVLYPIDAPEFSELSAMVREGKSVSQELRRRRRDGQLIDVLHTISPIYDPNGEVVGVSTISRDISHIKQAERESEMAIRNRDQFLAMLSHELRNPLGAVLNSLQLLQMHDFQDPRQNTAREIAYRQALQMSKLLDDLLDVSRVTLNKIVLRKSPCRIAEIIREAISSLGSMLEARGQTVEARGLDLPLLIFGDPSRLQQVFVNIIKNAIKYSPAGSVIEVELSASDDTIVVRIIDSGVGISEGMLDKIFDLFVQSKKTLDRSDGGLGVGLTLVKAIVELHGGQISATSEGGGAGSEFTVRLPLVRSEDAVSGDEMPPVQPKSASAAAGSNLTGLRPARGERFEGGSSSLSSPSTAVPTPLKIAVLEDNVDSRTTLEALLQLQGHEVRTAGDGRLGLELIQSWRPDVAIVDIGLPELDGLTVAQRSSEVSDLPTFLIALTGYGLETDRQQALAAGFAEHLVKPLNMAVLNSILRSVVERLQAGAASG